MGKIKSNSTMPYFIALLMCSSLVTSCPFFFFFDDPIDEDDLIHKISLEVEWEVPVLGFAGNRDYVIDGNRLYVPESSSICAIDLDTGRLIWRVQNVFSPGSNPVVYDGRVFCLEIDQAILWMLDAETGSVEGKISIDYEGVLIDHDAIAIDGSRVFLPHDFPGEDGHARIGYIDLDQMFLVNPSGEGGYPEYQIKTYTAYTFEKDITRDSLRSDGMPVFDETYMYARAYYGNMVLDGVTTNGYIVCVDKYTFTEKWKVQAEYLYGFQKRPLLLVDDILYDSATCNSAWNKNCGEEIYQIKYSGAGNGGPYVFDDKLYFTNEHIDESWDEFWPGETIGCIDRFTGERIWSISYEHTLGSTPIVTEYGCYVTDGTKMNIYHPLTGALIGVDESLDGPLWQLAWITTYNRLMILPSVHTITGVKIP